MKLNEKVLSVRELCGPMCVSDANGYRICRAVHSALDPVVNPQTVVMDFSGVQVLTPAFLNAAVSCLYDGSYVPQLLERAGAL